MPGSPAMCRVERTNRLVTTLVTRHAGCKRPLSLAAHGVDDPHNAAAERRAKRVSLKAHHLSAPLPVNAASQAPVADLSADAGVMVLYVAPPVDAEPVDAVPLSTAHAGALVPYVAPSPIGVELGPINAVPLAAAAPGREAPDWISKLLLPRFKLRGDLPVILVDEKAVTKSDLGQQQNRFRLSNEGALRRLRPLLSAEDLVAADMLDEQINSRRSAAAAPPPDGVADGAEQGKKKRKKKAPGKKHEGLPVHVVAGRDLSIRPLKLSRWESSAGTVIKGEGYMGFIGRCGFRVRDVVQVWAFKQHEFRNFGVTMCRESPLYLVMVKKDGEQRQPAPPPVPAVQQSSAMTA